MHFIKHSSQLRRENLKNRWWGVLYRERDAIQDIEISQFPALKNKKLKNFRYDRCKKAPSFLTRLLKRSVKRHSLNIRRTPLGFQSGDLQMKKKLIISDELS
ncbi:hypothetical protein A9261_19525 [Vibrio tasmaniensis]|nr:hypothetical protein A9261_19525 [Vibrio tasmaniensis]